MICEFRGGYNALCVYYFQFVGCIASRQVANALFGNPGSSVALAPLALYMYIDSLLALTVLSQRSGEKALHGRTQLCDREGNKRCIGFFRRDAAFHARLSGRSIGHARAHTRAGIPRFLLLLLHHLLRRRLFPPYLSLRQPFFLSPLFSLFLFLFGPCRSSVTRSREKEPAVCIYMLVSAKPVFAWRAKNTPPARERKRTRRPVFLVVCALSRPPPRFDFASLTSRCVWS